LTLVSRLELLAFSAQHLSGWFDSAEADMSIPEITPAEFMSQRDQGTPLTLLDVREAWELGVANVPGTLHIPMGEVARRLSEIDPEQPVVVLCRSGRRSLEVAKLLQQNGYAVSNLAGGILAWSRDVDATIPTY
jgi:rhodanese-related sulfurtransferase